MKFKRGDRVVIDSENWSYMRQWREGAKESTGTIKEVKNTGWFDVVFDNGYRNSYEKGDLKLASAIEPEFSLEEMELATNLVNPGGRGK